MLIISFQFLTRKNHFKVMFLETFTKVRQRAKITFMKVTQWFTAEYYVQKSEEQWTIWLKLYWKSVEKFSGDGYCNFPKPYYLPSYPPSISNSVILKKIPFLVWLDTDQTNLTKLSFCFNYVGNNLITIPSSMNLIESMCHSALKMK